MGVENHTNSQEANESVPGPQEELPEASTAVAPSTEAAGSPVKAEAAAEAPQEPKQESGVELNGSSSPSDEDIVIKLRELLSADDIDLEKVTGNSQAIDSLIPAQLQSFGLVKQTTNMSTREKQ